MPIWHIGKRREALTGNSEVYKKILMRYLEKRGYYLKASSDIEATFADCILTKKNEEREYWLEAKATTVSLGESSFLSQWGKYLEEYLIRSPTNRFKMILACYNITNPTFFQRVFDKFESEAIKDIIHNIIRVSEPNVCTILSEANQDDIIKFFEDTLVIIANPLDLQIAEEKILPSPPITPKLSDAEYATEILSNFGDIKPLTGSDTIYLSLFQVSIPKKLFIGKTHYRTARSIFNEKPKSNFPVFQLEKGKLFSFGRMRKTTLLGQFINPHSVVEIEVKEFDKDENNRRIVIRILNRWIRNKCHMLGLWFDNKTRSYYFPKRGVADNPVTVTWKPKTRRSTRELTKPMMTDGNINYWAHRAAEIFVQKISENYCVQIKPRWLFSADGMYPFGGERADRLDRTFRKSIYNRNLNQFYDVLFWYRFVFLEIDARLDNIFTYKDITRIKVIGQVKVESDRKPNIEFEEEVEDLDKIEVFSVKLLDEYM